MILSDKEKSLFGYIVNLAVKKCWRGIVNSKKLEQGFPYRDRLKCKFDIYPPSLAKNVYIIKRELSKAIRVHCINTRHGWFLPVERVDRLGDAIKSVRSKIELALNEFCENYYLITRSVKASIAKRFIEHWKKNVSGVAPPNNVLSSFMQSVFAFFPERNSKNFLLEMRNKCSGIYDNGDTLLLSNIEINKAEFMSDVRKEYAKEVLSLLNKFKNGHCSFWPSRLVTFLQELTVLHNKDILDNKDFSLTTKELMDSVSNFPKHRNQDVISEMVDKLIRVCNNYV